jgi:hypothetical protein
MKLNSFLSSFFIALLFLVNTPAQTPAPVETSKEEEQKAQQELEKKALSLLNEILDGAQLLKLPENRSYVFATAADLLWKHDEKRARTYFQSALADLAQAIRNPTSDDLRRGDVIWLLASSRQQILTTVARRDPQFALDLLQSTRDAFAENQPLWARMMDQELMLEQAIAAEVAAKDPKRALQMAKESLAKGVSYQTLTLLRRLNAKDSEAATSLAGDIVTKLRTLDFTKHREASMVAQGLLRLLIMPDKASSASQSKPTDKKPNKLTVDDQTTKELIDIVITAALNASNERSDLMMLQSLLPELEKRVPERVAQLRKKLSENSEKLDPAIKQMVQFQVLMRDGKPDEILEAAGKAPAEMRQYLYQSAASKLMQNGDLERARKVVADHMSGAEGDAMLASLDQKLIARALEQEKMEEARKLIERITPNEARLAQIANMATSLFAKGDLKTALALLDETKDLVNRPPENRQELNAMLMVAKAFATIEPARAFGVIEPVIDQANALLTAAAVLEKFGSDSGLLKNGEFRMQTSMQYSWSLTSQYGKEMASLASHDFARTRALAERFQRDEARIMARLLLVSAVLTVRNEKDDNSNNSFFGGDWD